MHATPEQARILREAVAAIKAHPETFDMSHWAEFLYENDEACGTTCCLAGQIVRNASTDPEWQAFVKAEDAQCSSDSDDDPAYPIRDRALELLGIEHEGVSPLFYQDEWPEQFITPDADPELWGPVPPTPEQLDARVEHWIETGE
jgi:hypothetical protein